MWHSKGLIAWSNSHIYLIYNDYTMECCPCVSVMLKRISYQFKVDVCMLHALRMCWLTFRALSLCQSIESGSALPKHSGVQDAHLNLPLNVTYTIINFGIFMVLILKKAVCLCVKQFQLPSPRQSQGTWEGKLPAFPWLRLELIDWRISAELLLLYKIM